MKKKTAAEWSKWSFFIFFKLGRNKRKIELHTDKFQQKRMRIEIENVVQRVMIEFQELEMWKVKEKSVGWGNECVV